MNNEHWTVLSRNETVEVLALSKSTHHGALETCHPSIHLDYGHYGNRLWLWLWLKWRRLSWRWRRWRRRRGRWEISSAMLLDGTELSSLQVPQLWRWRSDQLHLLITFLCFVSITSGSFPNEFEKPRKQKKNFSFLSTIEHDSLPARRADDRNFFFLLARFQLLSLSSP